MYLSDAGRLSKHFKWIIFVNELLEMLYGHYSGTHDSEIFGNLTCNHNYLINIE